MSDYIWDATVSMWCSAPVLMSSAFSIRTKLQVWSRLRCAGVVNSAKCRSQVAAFPIAEDHWARRPMAQGTGGYTYLCRGCASGVAVCGVQHRRQLPHLWLLLSYL